MSDSTVSILGCGWLGKPLGTQLVNAGYVVMGSTTKNEKVAVLQEAGIKPFVLTVDELLTDDHALPFFNSDILVISLPHGVKAGKANDYVDKIHHVIKAAHRGSIKSIILISTTSVYPNLNREVTEEDADLQNPIVQAESIVCESGIPSTILRMSGLFGPGRHPGKFLAGKSDVRGGDTPVNLVHLDDCIGIIVNIIQHNVWNKVLNVCADGHPTRRTFYTQAAIELGLQPPVFSEDFGTDYKIVSNKRVKEVLKYTFVHQL